MMSQQGGFVTPTQLQFSKIVHPASTTTTTTNESCSLIMDSEIQQNAPFLQSSKLSIGSTTQEQERNHAGLIEYEEFGKTSLIADQLHHSTPTIDSQGQRNSFFQTFGGGTKKIRGHILVEEDLEEDRIIKEEEDDSEHSKSTERQQLLNNNLNMLSSQMKTNACVMIDKFQNESGNSQCNREEIHPKTEPFSHEEKKRIRSKSHLMLGQLQPLEFFPIKESPQLGSYLQPDQFQKRQDISEMTRNGKQLNEPFQRSDSGHSASQQAETVLRKHFRNGSCSIIVKKLEDISLEDESDVQLIQRLEFGTPSYLFEENQEEFNLYDHQSDHFNQGEQHNKNYSSTQSQVQVNRINAIGKSQQEKENDSSLINTNNTKNRNQHSNKQENNSQKYEQESQITQLNKYLSRMELERQQSQQTIDQQQSHILRLEEKLFGQKDELKRKSTQLDQKDIQINQLFEEIRDLRSKKNKLKGYLKQAISNNEDKERRIQVYLNEQTQKYGQLHEKHIHLQNKYDQRSQELANSKQDIAHLHRSLQEYQTPLYNVSTHNVSHHPNLHHVSYQSDLQTSSSLQKYNKDGIPHKDRSISLQSNEQKHNIHSNSAQLSAPIVQPQSFSQVRQVSKLQNMRQSYDNHKSEVVNKRSQEIANQKSTTYEFGQKSMTYEFGQNQQSSEFGQKLMKQEFAQKQQSFEFGQQLTTQELGQKSTTQGFAQKQLSSEFAQKQSEFGQKQSDFGQKQSEFGQKQSEFGQKQSEFGQKQSLSLEFGQKSSGAARSNNPSSDFYEKEQQKYFMQDNQNKNRMNKSINSLTRSVNTPFIQSCENRQLSPCRDLGTSTNFFPPKACQEQNKSNEQMRRNTPKPLNEHNIQQEQSNLNSHNILKPPRRIHDFKSSLSNKNGSQNQTNQSNKLIQNIQYILQ